MFAQLLDEFGAPVLSPAFVERYLHHSWNPADKVEGCAAEEGLVTDHRGGDDVPPEVFAAEDIIEHVGGLRHIHGNLPGHGHPFDRSALALGQGDSLRPFRTRLDPGGEQLKFVLLKGQSFIRHETLVNRAQVRAPDDFALSGFAGDDGLGLLTTFQHEGVGFHPQATLGLTLLVATDAVGLQDGLDVALEVGRTGGPQRQERKEDDVDGLRNVRSHRSNL